MFKSIIILKILISSFGFKFRFVAVTLFQLTLGAYAGVTGFIDHILFPKYKLNKPANPVFLMGHPRSGTTFLHRFIVKHCDELRGMYLVDMIFPSLIARKIIKPFHDRLAKISLDKIWNPKIHKAGLFEAETEDVALFVKYGSGLLSWYYFHLWDKFKTPEDFDKRIIKVCGNDKFIDYLTSVHQKNIYNTNRRMFCKSFALIYNIDKILKEYSNAKILFMVRNPKETIPSTISLMSGAQKKINGLDKAPESKRLEFYDKVYKTSLAYYKYMDKIISENRENIIVYTQKQLLTDFEIVFRGILDFYGVITNEKIEAAITEQVGKQKTFHSEHKYSLGEYGISEVQIEEDFKFVYDNYPV
ncbi:MAG: sulfotransferase [bacterium]